MALSGPGPQRPPRGAATQPPPESGQRHAGRALLGARGRRCVPAAGAWAVHQPLLPGRTRRPHGPLGGSSCPVPPPRVAPGRQGAAALSFWLGRARPTSRALPDSVPAAARRCAAPPRVLGTRPPLAHGLDASRPVKRQPPNRANRGVSGGISHRESGGGGASPLLPQPAGGGTQPETDPPGTLRLRGGRGGAAGGGKGGLQNPRRPGEGGGGAAQELTPPPAPPPERGPRWSPRCNSSPPSRLPRQKRDPQHRSLMCSAASQLP